MLNPISFTVNGMRTFQPIQVMSLLRQPKRPPAPGPQMAWVHGKVCFSMAEPVEIRSKKGHNIQFVNLLEAPTLRAN